MPIWARPRWPTSATSLEPLRQIARPVEHLLQFSPAQECIGGAIPVAKLFDPPASFLPPVEIAPEDGVQVIFTSGSTGSPKPALLSHRGIICQNLCLGTAFDFGPGQRVLLNLPASHVGGQAEILMTTLFSGGTAVVLEVFDAALSLASIQKYQVTLLGQIPAMFQMEWRQSAYESTDFSSLRVAVYGGQAVPRPFLEKMRTMAPMIATGLGLTETSGFVTYTPMTGTVEDLEGTLGPAAPAYPMSVRSAMLPDGRAGQELPAGDIGHVCFRGPQTFLGYVNNPEATALILSSDGWLYTGDMGLIDERGLRLSGRAKWIIKTAGYQVFPGDVENHFSHLADRVASVGVVGCEHALWGEAMVAFVEKRPGADLTESDLRRHARSLAGYMRPLHYVLLEPGAHAPEPLGEGGRSQAAGVGPGRSGAAPRAGPLGRCAFGSGTILTDIYRLTLHVIIVHMDRAQWVSPRLDDKIRTQMHYARQGVITEEMQYVAPRERCRRRLVRAEVARGRMIIPANINHTNLEPMASASPRGARSTPTSATRPHFGHRRRTRKAPLLRQVRRRYRDGSLHRRRHPGDPQGHHRRLARSRSAPCRSTKRSARVRRVEDLNAQVMLEVIEEQAEQGVDYMTIHAGVLVQYIPLTTRRVTGIVSRGGSILAEWMVKNHKQNLLYECFEDICKIFQKHDVSFSLGDGLRPGCARRCQRRGAVRRTEDAGRADARSPGSTTCR